MAKVEVKVLSEKCIGCGTCAALAPETFQISANGVSEIINQEGNSGEEKLEAARSCPVEAIEVVDTETGKVLWPG